MKDWKIGRRLGAGFALVLALVVDHRGHRRAAPAGRGRRDGGRWPEHSLTKERLAAAWQLGTNTNSVRTFSLLKSDDAAVQEYLQKNITATSAVITETQKKLEAMLVVARRAGAERRHQEEARRIRRAAQPDPQAQGRRPARKRPRSCTDTQLLPDARRLRREHPRHGGATSRSRSTGPLPASARSTARGRARPRRAGGFRGRCRIGDRMAADAQHRAADRRGAADRRDRGLGRPEPGIRDRARRRLRPAAARHGRDGRHAHRSGRRASRLRPIRSRWPRGRLRPATRTCPRAPSSRPARWNRRRLRWKS